MNGLTTIAAIPRTGGAGMALRGETNSRPIRYENPWALFSNHANISDQAKAPQGTGSSAALSLLWMEIHRERDAWESWVRGPGRQVNI